MRFGGCESEVHMNSIRGLQWKPSKVTDTLRPIGRSSQQGASHSRLKFCLAELTLPTAAARFCTTLECRANTILEDV